MCVCTHMHTHSQRGRAGRHWFRMRRCFQSVKKMNMFIHAGLWNMLQVFSACLTQF